VVGVVADFHQRSLLHPLEPIFFVANNRYGIYYTISLATPRGLQDINQSSFETLGFIQTKWEEFFPAGTGEPGFNGDRTPATQSKVHVLDILTVDDSGNIYFTDYGNNRIRKLSRDKK